MIGRQWENMHASVAFSSDKTWKSLCKSENLLVGPAAMSHLSFVWKNV
jgi:hypothetical protein